ncbi:hypothetical protein LCGC14_2175340 [marine sediment metagenome]|uniref:Methyltransferase type 11 domain-containing protein n=1 Tax=marine sediment metagenome TaxID=412755 RepID=A0A0F9G1J0_9ZZZZ
MAHFPRTDSFAALEKREWAKAGLAQSYARVFAKAADMVAPYLAGAVKAGADTDALDLCCGHGNVAAALVGAGARVTGLDFSPAMLDMARAAAPTARFIEGDAMDLPFADASFDAVTIGFGMPHVPEPPRVLAQARRVLRSGGRLAYSVWCGPGVDSALGYVFDAIACHGAADIALPPGPGAHDYADPAIAFPALKAVGFSRCRQSVVASEWQVDDPGAPYDFFRDGTARGGALLRPQPAEHAAAIRSAVVEKVLANHGPGPGWRVPIPAVITTAIAA